ncbi:MAG: 2Fe-2S iron-sulfur cluster-binding protein, partial [Desulfosarcina sp.]
MNDRVRMTIDGKPIAARRGENLLTVAHGNGIPIPSLCYHRKLTPTGACRLCITKIKGMRGLIAACTLAVSDELAVVAFDDELEAAR